MWTVYVDEAFLEAQMAWLLPDVRRVHPGLHPQEWNRSAAVAQLGLGVVQRVEPLLHRMARLGCSDVPYEQAWAQTVALFAQMVELTLPALLNTSTSCPRFEDFVVLAGRPPGTPSSRNVALAARLLRKHMGEPWNVERLASAAALSRTHLTRLFTRDIGQPPMRFLTQTRLVEFTRLIEETDLSIAAAASRVGRQDSRVATAWFRRLYGLSPSEVRRSARPRHSIS